jgi:hypothetical protein
MGFLSGLFGQRKPKPAVDVVRSWEMRQGLYPFLATRDILRGFDATKSEFYYEAGSVKWDHAVGKVFTFLTTNKDMQTFFEEDVSVDERENVIVDAVTLATVFSRIEDEGYFPSHTAIYGSKKSTRIVQAKSAEVMRGIFETIPSRFDGVVCLHAFVLALGYELPEVLALTDAEVESAFSYLAEAKTWMPLPMVFAFMADGVDAELGKSLLS